MAILIDTNIIIRFLVGDHEEHLIESTRIFEEIESGEIEVEILDVVLMDTLFVLTKFYLITHKFPSFPRSLIGNPSWVL